MKVRSVPGQMLSSSSEMYGPKQAPAVTRATSTSPRVGVYTHDIDASVERFEKAGGTAATRRAIPYATERGPETRVLLPHAVNVD